ncbi:hypothetical protein ACH5RR_029093 [Cinchona calisaya]|uniref:BED-type domain-containing protein n=1 Tax=Cinchona calisaya TaxID=153742 RepID=A0ABD2YTX7_9GENT
MSTEEAYVKTNQLNDLLPPTQPSSSRARPSEPEAFSNDARKRKDIAPRAKAWQHFRRFTSENGRQRAKCNYCKKHYANDTDRNGFESYESYVCDYSAVCYYCQ